MGLGLLGLGIVLLVVGLLFHHLAVLVTIGIICIVIGAVVWAVAALAGRRGTRP